MITDRAVELRNAYDNSTSNTERQQNAALLWDELIDNCDPTREEYIRMASLLIVTEGVFYRIMKATVLKK